MLIYTYYSIMTKSTKVQYKHNGKYWVTILLKHGQNTHTNYISSMVMFISYLMHVKIKQT